MSIVGEDGGFGFNVGGGRDFLSVEDQLRARGARSWLGSVGGPTVLDVVSNLSTFKASALSHTLCTFLWGEFLQFHEVYFHGVGVLGGSGGGRGLGSEVVITSSSMEFSNAKFVALEELSFLYPFFESVRW